jgi:DNA-directed RNA polymerase subunit RPC12/RpoP
MLAIYHCTECGKHHEEDYFGNQRGLTCCGFDTLVVESSIIEGISADRLADLEEQRTFRVASLDTWTDPLNLSTMTR